MYQIKAGERETYQKSVSLPPKPGELASLRLIQFLSKVFLHKNIQLELTKHCWALTSTSRYGNDNTKCCYKQYIRRQNTKTEQNFNPGLAIICLSGTGHCTTAALNLLHYPCTILGDPQRQSVGSGLVPPFLGFLGCPCTPARFLHDRLVSSLSRKVSKFGHDLPLCQLFFCEKLLEREGQKNLGFCVLGWQVIPLEKYVWQ